MLRLSINKALWIFGLVQVVSILGFAALARVGQNIYLLFGVVGFEYIGVGLGTVALTAYMAKQTNIQFTATQFALLTSLTAVPRTLANASTGFIVESVGYYQFFLICTVVAIPGLLLLFWVAPWNGKQEANQGPQPSSPS
jgi:PAT family beta-lactamase induction signal transducer AmpG